MASQMLGLAFFNGGMYPQCYSLFGGERRGAPVVSFLRVDTKKILLKCDIKHPHELLYFDSSLIDQEEIHSVMAAGGKLLINAVEPDDRLLSLTSYAVGLVNATHIARELGLEHMINTAVLGAYCRLTGALSLKHLVKAVEEMVPARKKINGKAVEYGYDNLILL
jgi:2-oxoacid:acceptor oxidoreductase gamma subunit (pyruvate/2-ketoisovalerate family)